MKRLLLLAVFCALPAFAQCGAYSNFASLTGSTNLSSAMDGKLSVQCGTMAPTALAGTAGIDAYVNTSTGAFYICTITGTPCGNWVMQTGALWGNVTGTLASQSDLVAALAAKQNSATANANNAGLGNCSSGQYGTGTAAGSTQPCAQVAYSQVSGTPANATVLCDPASGSGAAFTCTPSPALTAYSAGLVVSFVPDVSGSGGATTLDISALGAKSVYQSNGSSNPVSTDFVSAHLSYLTYNGTAFVEGPPGPSGATGPGGVGPTIARSASFTLSCSTDNLATQYVTGTSASITVSVPSCGSGANVVFKILNGSPTYTACFNFATNSVTANGASTVNCLQPIGAAGASILVLQQSAVTATDYATNTNGYAGPRVIPMIFDGGGSALTSGLTRYLVVPFGCVINNWTLDVDTGTATVDIWKLAGASNPNNTNIITNSASPTISSGNAAHGSASTWINSTVTVYDIVGFYLNAVTGATLVQVGLACN